MPGGSQQTAESDIQVPSTAETADPFLYPSWYKAQSRQASTPNATQIHEGLSKVGPSASLEMNVKKADATEAATTNENAPGSGKETTATSEVSGDDLLRVYLLGTGVQMQYLTKNV